MSLQEYVGNGSLFAWSPDGQFIARTLKETVFVENWRKGTLVKRRVCQDTIHAVEWTLDSSYVALGMFKIGQVRVISVDNPGWKCKIDTNQCMQNGLGLVDISWGPDCRQLLTTSSLYAEITVWSISTAKTTYIKNVLPVKRNKSFSLNGKTVVVLRFSKDCVPKISLYSTLDWSLIHEFHIACKDPEEIAWCPDGNCIAVRDSTLFCGLYIYSPTGELKRYLSPDGMSAGFLDMLWSPSGQFLVTVNHRNIIRILNNVTLGMTIEEKVEPDLLKIYPNCIKFNETDTHIIDGCHITSYDKEDDLIIIPVTGEVSPARRILTKFSTDGCYLAFWTDFYASTVWIWSIPKARLETVLVHLNDVTDISWKPGCSELAISTNRSLLHFWEPEGPRIESTKSLRNDSFEISNVCWNPNLPAIALVSREKGKYIVQPTE